MGAGFSTRAIRVNVAYDGFRAEDPKSRHQESRSDRYDNRAIQEGHSFIFCLGDFRIRRVPTSYEEMDEQLSEYIHLLVQSPKHIKHAGDCLSGFTRLFSTDKTGSRYVGSVL